jgi:hypothetical protein
LEVPYCFLIWSAIENKNLDIFTHSQALLTLFLPAFYSIVIIFLHLIVSVVLLVSCILLKHYSQLIHSNDFTFQKCLLVSFYTISCVSLIPSLFPHFLKPCLTIFRCRY